MVSALRLKLSIFAMGCPPSFLLDLTKYQVLFESCCRYIGETDVYATYARNAFEFNYTKPILCLDKLEKSFVRADALRHPIIERILTKELFTPNNLEDNQMLLYGTNAVGKTSYIKSIALAVLMAQAGMYVPASKFEFYPYRYIQSRIPSGDDLMNGHSTFTVEMRELRYILSCAGHPALGARARRRGRGGGPAQVRGGGRGRRHR